MKVRLALACVAIVCGLSFTVADASTSREYPIGTINYEAQPEREVINVRRGEGAFRGIRLEVRQSDVDIRDLRVTYDDGSSDTIRVNQLVRAGGTTRVFDVDSRRREVRSVAINFLPQGAARIVLVAVGGMPAPGPGPGDWSLLGTLGFMLSDANKFPAFRDPDETFTSAAKLYQQAADTGNAPPYIRRAQFYALARAKGHEKEAFDLAKSLYAEPKNRLPTLLILFLVLEAHENPSLDVAGRAIELFDTPERALEALSGHWQRTRERFPVYGVAHALESLEKTLAVPPEKSILAQPLQNPNGPEQWFGK